MKALELQRGEFVVSTDPLRQDLRRWTPATRDAHGLYAQFGFTPLIRAENFMELHNPMFTRRPADETGN
jgi:hypothetical protein